MLPLLFLLLFIGIPIAEIWLIIQVGHAIGGLDTILLLIADSIFGSWLLRREGMKAWTRLRAALAEGRMPNKELADGALVVVGGALLITPGFISDVFGLLCVLPFTRPVVRSAALRYAARRAGGTKNRGGVRIVEVHTHTPDEDEPPLSL